MAVKQRKTKGRGRGRPSNEYLPGNIALLRAGQSEFASHGYKGASLRQIAFAAGVDPGLAHHHFGSKEALWKAVVERLGGSLVPLIHELNALQSDRCTPIKTRLGIAFKQLVGLTCAEPELGKFFARIDSESGKRLEFMVEHYMRPYHDAFIPLLAEAMEEGLVPKQPLEVLYCMVIYAVSMTVSYRHVLAEFGEPIEDTNKLKNAILECVFATFLHERP